MRRLELEVIPVPEEVLARQAAIRAAREVTRQMYGTPGPHKMETPEYHYFLEMLYGRMNYACIQD